MVAAIPAISCMWLAWAGGAEPEKPLVLLDSADFRDQKAFEKHWTHYSAENGSPFSKTWTIIEDGNDPVLKCEGKPTGYIRTKGEFENFELTLQWKYPDDKNGNSGILIHTTGKDKIWPMSIQIQLHTPVAGSVFPTGGAKTANVLSKKGLALAVNQWHTCRIRSEDGKVTLFINDEQIGEVTGCQPKKGNIALQSENSETHFRRIKLTKLKPTSKP
jgi:hypothetical protein